MNAMKKTPKINPQVRWAAVKFIPRIGLSKPLPAGDWSGRRARSAARQVKLEKLLAKISPPPSDVVNETGRCASRDRHHGAFRIERLSGLGRFGGGCIAGWFLTKWLTFGAKKGDLGFKILKVVK